MPGIIKNEVCKLRRSSRLAIAVIVLLAICRIFTRDYVYPNTYVAQTNLSGKTKAQLESFLYEQTQTIYKIKVRDRIYSLRLADMGLKINNDVLIRTAFKPNGTWFPKSVVWYFFSLKKTTLLEIPLETTDRYTQFVNTLVFQFNDREDEINLDQTTGRLTYTKNKQIFKVDADNLKYQIFRNFGLPHSTIEPNLVELETDLQYVVKNLNARLSLAISKPISLRIIKDNSTMQYTINPEELVDLLSVDVNQSTSEISYGTNKDNTIRWLSERSINPTIPVLGLINRELARLLEVRAAGTDMDTITLSVNEGPNSPIWEINQHKYMEADLSQQKLFLFENQELIRTLRISSGKYYPTPTGKFKVLNKAVNAYSEIFDVWMPYWMAFGYSSELNAYFGLHELPYWIDPGGTKIQRPREKIGTPSTGGCIALDIGEAKELFDWAENGTPLSIYE